MRKKHPKRFKKSWVMTERKPVRLCYLVSTTIQQLNLKLIAQTAMIFLIKEIEGEFSNVPHEICLPVKLLEGQTT